ncbi:MAG: DUF2158 domain-containing protein [Beijerinckiaceae bacterium]
MTEHHFIPQFDIGAVVHMRSGGPGLTVLGYAGDRVHCVFFSEEIGEFRETMLPEVALELITLIDMEDGDEDEENEGEEETEHKIS